MTFEGLTDRLKTTVVDVLTESGLINTNPTHSSISGDNNNLSNANNDEFQVFMYNGQYHRVPESFNLNGIDGKAVYRMWHFALPQDHICPFKLLTGKDMPSKNMARNCRI